MTARQFKLTGSTSYSSRLLGTVALKRGEHILLDDGKDADHIASLSQVVGDREETLFTEVGPGLAAPTIDLTTKVLTPLGPLPPAPPISPREPSAIEEAPASLAAAPKVVAQRQRRAPTA